jgi:hypothetical protein
LILARYAIGRHLYDVRTEHLVPFAKVCGHVPPSDSSTDAVQMNLASLTLYNFSITLAKVSVCMTYLHLFPSRTNKIFSWTLIVYQTLWCVIISVLYIIQCIPIQAIWDPSITDKVCLDSHELLTASAALGILSDFLIFLWPVMPLWQVKLPLLQRVHLVSVFSFGVFTCVAGMLKAIWAQEYFRTWDITCKPSYSPSICMLLNQAIRRGRCKGQYRNKHGSQCGHHERLPPLPATSPSHDLPSTLCRKLCWTKRLPIRSRRIVVAQNTLQQTKRQLYQVGVR